MCVIALHVHVFHSMFHEALKGARGVRHERPTVARQLTLSAATWKRATRGHARGADANGWFSLRLQENHFSKSEINLCNNPALPCTHPCKQHYHSSVCAILTGGSRGGHDIVRIRDIVIAARYRTRVLISWDPRGIPRYRAFVPPSAATHNPAKCYARCLQYAQASPSASK